MGRRLKRMNGHACSTLLVTISSRKYYSSGPCMPDAHMKRWGLAKFRGLARHWNLGLTEFVFSFWMIWNLITYVSWELESRMLEFLGATTHLVGCGPMFCKESGSNWLEGRETSGASEILRKSRFGKLWLSGSSRIEGCEILWWRDLEAFSCGGFRREDRGIPFSGLMFFLSTWSIVLLSSRFNCKYWLSVCQV